MSAVTAVALGQKENSRLALTASADRFLKVAPELPAPSVLVLIFPHYSEGAFEAGVESGASSRNPIWEEIHCVVCWGFSA